MPRPAPVAVSVVNGSACAPGCQRGRQPRLAGDGKRPIDRHRRHLLARRQVEIVQQHRVSRAWSPGARKRGSSGSATSGSRT